MTTTRVLVAEGQPLVREGIRRALEGVEDIRIVGEAATGRQVLPFVERTRPDLVLLGVDLPYLDGFTCLELILRDRPGQKVVMLSETADAEYIRAAFTRGAYGYVVIGGISPTDLPAVLRQALSGSIYLAIDPGVGSGSPGGQTGLTEREVAILACVARGLSNRRIGRELWLSEHTVKCHLTRIYKKLGVDNRTAAARYAVRNGLASPL